MGIRHKPKQRLSSLKIVIAGGVTGGHLFPGIAVAQEFMSKDSANRVLFMSLGNPLERKALKQSGFELVTIPVSGIKGRGGKDQIMSVLSLPGSIFTAMRHLKHFKPNLVIGMGGYSAGPVAAAAWMLGTRVVIHEQNILPGITNRILSRIASRIYVSFEQSLAGFDRRKVRFSGNPVRHEFIQTDREKEAVSEYGRKDKDAFVVFIVGGSQGAHGINMAMVDALDHIKDKGRYFFIHQTGTGDVETVKNAYMRKGFKADVRAFINDMAQQYKNADLVICRSGATTVAEITALGKSTIFIPFPHAADNHQALNAKSMVDAGAAEMILEGVLEGKLLARRIEHYAANPEIVLNMGNLAKKHGKPDAAAFIVNDCYSLLGIPQVN